MSEKKTVSATTDKATKIATKPISETVMYVGPNIHGVATSRTLYKNGKLPELFQKKVEKHPVLKSLLIPVSDLPRVNQELQDPKSAVSICYARAVELIKESNKKEEV